IYLYRRIRKGCDEELFGSSNAVMQLQVDLGGYVGISMSHIGLSYGLLATGMAHLASLMFLGVDKNGYAKYKKSIKRKGMTFDQAEEQEMWGCTHSQIASMLTQPLGLGKAVGSAMTQGLAPKDVLDANMSNQSYAVYIVPIWVEALMKNGKEP